MDLSFPHQHSVNDGIPKDTFLGEPFQLRFPGVDALVALVQRFGSCCLLFKRDLRRAYRQSPVDPPDYHLLGFTCNKLLFFDTVLTFGLRPATLACQRTTSAIQFMHQQMEYVSTNYIDDFGGCDTLDQADDALHALQFLFDLFGIESSPEKNCPPSTLMTFLSILFNTVTMTHSIPDNKISDLLALIQQILQMSSISRHRLQSILGLMSFITACFRPNRIIMSALLNGLRGLPRHGHLSISAEIHSDLEWWLNFLPWYNGISLIPPPSYTPNILVTDACANGAGGYFGFGMFLNTVFTITTGE